MYDITPFTICHVIAMQFGLICTQSLILTYIYDINKYPDNIRFILATFVYDFIYSYRIFPLVYVLCLVIVISNLIFDKVDLDICHNRRWYMNG